MDVYEVLLALGVILWVAAAIMYGRSGVASVYHPATYYMFFHGLIFVFRPIMSYFLEYRLIYDLYHFNPDLAVKEMVLIAANIGFICFMVTVVRIGNAPLVLRATRNLPSDLQRSQRWSLVPTTLLLAPIGIAAMIYWLRIASGDAEWTMVTDARSHIVTNTTTSGYFTSASDFVGALGVLIAWQCRFRLWSLLPFAAFVMVRAASGSARWTFLLTTASLCLLYLYDRKAKWPNTQTITVGSIALGVFVLVGEQRDVIVAYLRGQEPSSDIFKQRFMEGLDFGNLEFFEYLVSIIPGKTGTWGYFLNNLQLFTEPVPRILWPGKPIGPPIQMFEIWNYGTPIGITYSLPGEGWVQLGIVGVIIWCSLAGTVMGKLYNMFVRSKQTGFQVGLYMLLIPLSVQIYRDGLLITAFKFPLFFIMTVIVWKTFSVIFKDRKATGHGMGQSVALDGMNRRT